MNNNSILKHPLLKSGIVYILCDAVNKGVPFLILPVLSNYLLPSDYGILSNFNVLLSIITIFITVGIDSSIAVNFYRLSKTELSKYIFNALLLVSTSLVICTTAVLLSSNNIYALTKVPVNYQLLAIAMSLSAVFTAINLSMWRLEEKPLKFGLYDVSQTLVNIGFSLFFVVYLKMDWIGRVNGILIASIVFGLFSFALLIKRGYLIADYNISYLKGVLLFGLPLIPHSLSFWVRSGIDRIYITKFIDETATGLYATAFQFGILISFLTLSFNNAFVPYLYKMLTEQNVITLIKNKIKLVRITYLVILGIMSFSAVFILLSNIIIQEFFSQSYDGAKIYVFWAILSQMFQGFYLLFVNYIFFICVIRACDAFQVLFLLFFYRIITLIS
jgi:O-antigen/teichoic acid export membrane protein